MVLLMIDIKLMIGGKIMQLRKLLYFNGSNALILPIAFVKHLEASPGDYMEVGLSKDKAIIIRKHIMPNERKRPDAR